MRFFLELLSSIDGFKLKKIRNFLLVGQDIENKASFTDDGQFPSDLIKESRRSEDSVENWDSWDTNFQKPVDLKYSSSLDTISSDDATIVSSHQAQPQHFSWMDGILAASAGSAAEVLVFALDYRFAIVRSKPQFLEDTGSSSSKDDLSMATASTSGAENDFTLAALVETDYLISTVFAFQLASSQRSSAHLPDWTAIVVGTEDGFLLFYTDRGTLIYRQQFTHSSVLSLDFRTVLHGAQELSVFHEKSCLVTIDGLSLFTALKGCKNQVARGASSVEELSEMVDLIFKKWTLNSVESGSQHACTGPFKPGSFDQLENATVHGGFYARVQKVMPHYTTYCVTGSSPLVNFCWLDDSASQPGITDALYSLADKVKSSMAVRVPSGILGFWGSSNQQNSASNKPKPVDIRSTQMPSRTMLKDAYRQGQKMYLSPDGSMAAIADAQARVLLVLTSSRTVVRIWKGYRDAQCGWIEAKGEIGEDQARREGRAFFLAIFAPRRGLLEVWTAQNGPRVAAFNVDKGGRILSPSTKLVLGGSAEIDVLGEITFLNSGGNLFTVKIPFHAALKDESIAQVHDMHIMKTFKAIFSNADMGSDELCRCFTDFKTVSYLRQALEIAIDMEGISPGLLGKIVEHVLEILSKNAAGRKSSDEPQFSSVEARILRSHCIVYRQIINLYALILARYFTDVADSSWNSETNSPEGLNNVAEILNLATEDLQRYVNTLETCTALRAKVEGLPCSGSTFALNSMIKSYDFNKVTSGKLKNSTVDGEQAVELHLDAECSSWQFAAFGEFLLRPVLTGQCSIDTFRTEIVLLSGLDSMDLLKLLLAHWLGEVHGYSANPVNLLNLLLILLGLEKEKTSEFLTMVEKELAATSNIPEAFTLCLVLRSLGKHSVAKMVTIPDNPDPVELETELSSEWDEIQVTLEKWELISMNIYALLLLDGLRLNAVAESENLGSMLGKLSFGEFLIHGSGYYREKFGHWMAATMVNVNQVSAALKDNEMVSNTTDTWAQLVRELGTVFSRSFAMDLVMADCSWEQGSLWHRVPEEVDRMGHYIASLEAIEHPALRHGVSYLLWETFVKERFQKLYMLMEKVKKFPKDRQCRKEVEISESKMMAFVEHCGDLLKIMWQANAEYELSRPYVFSVEDFIHNLFALPEYRHSNGCGKETLPENASREKCTNYHLLLHHWQLTQAVYLQLWRGVKSTAPSSLFDQKGRNAFFVELHSHPLLPMAEVDNGIKIARHKFLTTCISSLVESCSADELPNCTRVYELAQEWGIPSGVLRRHEVGELYAHGKDNLGERLLHSVEEKALMGSELLFHFGSRLSKKIRSMETDVWSRIESVSASWIRSFSKSESDKDPRNSYSLMQLKQLHGHVVALLPKNHAEAGIAADLEDVLTVLHELDSRENGDTSIKC